MFKICFLIYYLFKFKCLALAYTIVDLKHNPPKNMPFSWGLRVIFNRWMKLSPMPCILSFTYGTTLCASASIRNKDDTFNFFVASTILGLTLTTISMYIFLIFIN